MNAFAPLQLMLGHEVRLYWRQMASRSSHALLLTSFIGILVFMHLVAIPFVFILPEMSHYSRVDILAGLTGAGVFGVMMAISVALVGTVKLIYSRSDMDLLLSSPVPAQSVVFVRVLAIAFGILCIAAPLTLPFANIFTAFGYPRFLVTYAVVICLVLLATSIGVLLAQGMFRLFGARRTRVFAQIFAGILGVGFLFAVNAHNILPEGAKNALMQVVTDLAGHAPGPDSWLWLPARAMLGEPLPFLVGVVLCVGLFMATTFGLANRLIDNAIAANGVAGKTVRSSRSLSLRGGPVTILRRKEWLLIGRDPWLISQIVMQLLVMVPAMFVIAKAGSQIYMWLTVVYLTGQLAGALAWLTVSTEEAPDLLMTAPLRRRDVLLAKMQAALIPTAVLAAVPVAVAFWINPWLGFTLMLCSTGAGLTNSLLHVLNPTTAKRSDLSWRGNANKMITIFELLFNLMWAIFGALMLALGWWGMLALLVLVPFGYRVMRRAEVQA
jgi:ABC-2 type transport system permease protein